MNNINDNLTKALKTVQKMIGPTALQKCYIDLDAAARMADFSTDLGIRRCLVISDSNTRAAAGEHVFLALRYAGNGTTDLVLKMEPLEATIEIAEFVTEKAANLDGIVAVGAGTLSDLAKYAGNKLQKPVLLYATAPSMNGYTSSIVALRIKGLKQTIPVKPASGVFADPEVLVAAPSRMIAAGFADYLSKSSASADWAVAHMLRSEPYKPEAFEFYKGIYDELLSLASEIGTGKPEAITKLMQGLLLSGLSMLAAGASSPVSGGEHLISHYLDMKSAFEGVSHDLHGAQVGVATIQTLSLWQQVLNTDPTSIDPEKLSRNYPSKRDIEAAIEEDWGPVAKTILEQWRPKSRTPHEIRMELELFKSRADEFLGMIRKEMETPQKIAQAIQAVGGPITAKELTIRERDFQKAISNARFLRNRFTILDLAAELGLIPPFYDSGN